MNQVSVLFLALFCVLLTTLAQIALKIGVSSPGMTTALSQEGLVSFVRHAALTPMVLIGLALYVASVLLWLVILARAEVSYVYPLVSVGFILTAAYGYWFLGEAVTPARICGIALVCVGVFFI